MKRQQTVYPPPIMDVQKTIARQTAVCAKRKKEQEIDQSPQKKSN